MYNFEKLLFPDEKILYQGRPIPGKGHKNIRVTIFMLIFLALIQIIMFYTFKTEGISLDAIVIFLVLFIFEGLLLYSFIYNVFIKKHAVSDDEYCLTNQRAFKYESKTGNLIFGYLANYRSIRTLNVKDNFGDVRMEMIYKNVNNTNLAKNDLVELKNLMLHPNEENMPYMLFESIENPERIVSLIIEARKELQKK